MCRWLAYSGSPVLMEELLYKPQHSLIVQSLHSQLGAEETNGDGFGVGWYGELSTPAVFRSIEPAWNDRNLRELSGHIRSGVVFAHIRASTGSPVQQTNCHPFRHGRWLWMHNGLIHDFLKVKRDLVLEIDPSVYPDMEGTTDSEVIFHLALTFGLEDDPPTAVERAVGLVEAVGARHGVEHPMQGTMATTNGETLWAFRYSSEGKSRSLFFSTDVRTLKAQHPEIPALHELSDESRLVVSELLGDLAGAWHEVPESSYGVVGPGQAELRPFTPRPPEHASNPKVGGARLERATSCL
ncbi:MAG TPA: class II glutamine amidotransferase [Thermoleophilaceae bacterium]